MPNYERFAPDVAKFVEPAITISSSQKISLNAAVTKKIIAQGIEYLALLWDPKTHSFAFKGSSPEERGAFRITFNKKHHGAHSAVSAVSFLRFIGWNSKTSFSVPVQWNEEEQMFEGVLPSEHIKGSTHSTTAKKKSLRT